MKLPQILSRLTDRTQAPRSWWWPAYVREEATERAVPESDDEASAHFGEACLTIRRVMLAIVIYSCFCLFTLGAPDRDLLENKILIPFASVEVNFFDFATVGPAILVGLTVYLQVFLGYWRANRLKTGDSEHPFLFNMSGTVPRTLTNFLFYWLPPLVLAAFAYKIDPYTESSFLPVFTLFVVVLVIFLQIRRFHAKLRHSVAYRGMWVLFAFTSAFTVLVAANRVASTDFGDIKEGASEVLNGVTLAAMAMIGIEFVQVAQVGQVESVRGEATADRVSGDKIPLRSEDPVFEKDTLETGPDGSVVVTLLDGKKLSLGPRSKLTLGELVHGGAGTPAAPTAFVETGTLTFITGKSPGMLPFRKLDLTSLDLTGTSLNRRNLRDANLAKSNLSGVNLAARDLRGAVLDGANLEGTDLRDANLANAQLVNARLINAIMANINLENANLDGGELEDADLRTANLRGTVLTDTDLRGADFEGADFRGADLTGARNLAQAQLNQACGDRETRLPEGLQLKPCGSIVPYTIKTPTASIGIRG